MNLKWFWHLWTQGKEHAALPRFLNVLLSASTELSQKEHPRILSRTQLWNWLRQSAWTFLGLIRAHNIKAVSVNVQRYKCIFVYLCIYIYKQPTQFNHQLWECPSHVLSKPSHTSLGHQVVFLSLWFLLLLGWASGMLSRNWGGSFWNVGGGGEALTCSCQHRQGHLLGSWD